jgi:hypothetical protein
MAELSSSKVYGDLAVNGSIAEGSITLSNKYAPYSTTSSAGRFDATTTAPTDTTTRINFNGYLYATKVFSPAYGDLAEFFEGDEQVEPGDVIIVNPNGNGFIKSQKSYDKLVVGVYSDTYGYVLNGSGGDELNNRIPVGISAESKLKQQVLLVRVIYLYHLIYQVLQWLLKITFQEQQLGKL